MLKKKQDKINLSRHTIPNEVKYLLVPDCKTTKKCIKKQTAQKKFLNSLIKCTRKKLPNKNLQKSIVIQQP